MKLDALLTGPETSLTDMLEAREQRVHTQRKLLKAFPMSLICFTMNIPGPHKMFPLAVKAFEEGLTLLKYSCRAYGFPVVNLEVQRLSTGYQCFLSTTADPVAVKRQLSQIEDSFPLGRLYDMDVLDREGNKISREDLELPQRTCLICGGPAFQCSRGRTHSLSQLLEKVCRIILDYFDCQYAQHIAHLAVRALIQEVRTTPKPGLVDLSNTGAHKDMDVGTFEESALALLPCFENFVLYGIHHCQEEPAAMLSQLRALGMDAEVQMLSATGGVNTHKGLIFSLGILLCALGICRGREKTPNRLELRNLSREISSPLQNDFFKMEGHTNGEKSFRSHGVKGARGEAIQGFPALFTVALPVLDHLSEEPQAGVAALLEIIASTEDTNVIARSSYEKAEEIRTEIQNFLSSSPDGEEILHFARQLDRSFIEQNISPGGSADILALGYFVKLLEENGILICPHI